MDVVLIYNGLGNQMSQYALYLSKKMEGQDVRYICLNTAHNGIELEKLFGIDTKMRLYDIFLILIYHIVSTRKYPILFKPLQYLLGLVGVTVIREGDDYSYRPEVSKQGENKLRFLSGGWHHSNYFSIISEKIKETYSFPEISDDSNLEVLNKTNQNKSVAIHIRRGDFLDKYNYEKFGKVCTDDYYNKAIEKISSIVDNPVFYIFTNDVSWARTFFKGKNHICVEWNFGENSWKDLYLMSKFKNIIIANSTFSWWAAWLGSDINKSGVVICPSKFTSFDNESGDSIYLKEWYKI